MKKSYLYGVAALGLLFTGCSSDDLTTDHDVVSTDGARTFYVNLNIRGEVTGNETRAVGDDGVPTATDFSDGESDVKDAYFVFYDKEGSAIGKPIEVPLNNATWETSSDGTVDKYYKSVVGVTVSNGQENPSQVICYLNPQNTDNLTLPIKKIQEATRKELYITGGTKKFFSMSNSVFYPNTEAAAPQIAVQISPNQLFNTREAALAATNDNARVVNVYVERYAAKLTFKTTKPEVYQTYTRDINSTELGTSVELTFVPSTWMLNASCEDTYVVKSFREENGDGSNPLEDNYAYQELNDVINKPVDGVSGNWVWNATNFNRSYWGMSPAYFTSVYPEVSSDVAVINNGSDALNQHYYSYNELIEGIGGNEPVGYALPTDENGVTEYVHETTVGSKALESLNVVAAFPSVILVGDYTLRIGDQTLTDTDFYTYSVVSQDIDKPLVYFNAVANPSDEGYLTGKSAIKGGESILRGLIASATNLYKKDGDNYVNFDLKSDSDVEKLVTVLEVVAPSEEVRGTFKLPERYRTLQFKADATQDELDGIYIATSEGYNSIATSGVSTPAANQVTQNFANQELMQAVGYCAKYNAGAAYFNIPVKHYGWYRSTNVNKDKTEINWSKVRVGDFGVVRNHSYTVDVTAITGIGTGIGGKDNPIVPPSQENKYYIAYSVNILKWAVVPTQKVTL